VDWLIGQPDSAILELVNLPLLAETHVQAKSSPGFPYIKYGKTNAHILASETYKGIIYSAVAQRVRRILTYSKTHDFDTMKPEEFVELGLVDPIKIFIKSEPHKLSKLQEGKLRIISNVSLVDQLIERMLCSNQNQLEISEWRNCPSKPGMGLHDEGMQELYHGFLARQSQERIAETDVSAWDWSVPGWLLQLEGDLRQQLYGAPQHCALTVLLKFRASVIARKVFITSDGDLFSQIKPGIQASGSYLTSSSNSRMRVSLGYLIGADWVEAMGDDDVESEVPNARQLYSELGFSVKDYKRCPTGIFEFCSTRFDGSWKGVPVQWARTLYRYLSHSPAARAANPAYRVQLLDDLRHHPEQQEIVERADIVVAAMSKRLENGDGLEEHPC